ncbi:nitrilase-related carbon-nitrogen hydrolase [Desulfonatronospira sp.]|uniref:nitrilase-related carbon-nitrogen hydrolase n=1 Tax=Desulfonatronospira sp. TaxID=1962951 RepID=UPI0025BA6B56|nr:nitrilase-related carbon-nitrogen hydrolase [Desulfonatronospira sp.]
MEAITVGVCQSRVMRQVEDIRHWLDLIDREEAPCLWVFPELFMGGFDYPRKDRCVEMNLEVREIIADFARQTGNILAGTFWEEKGGRIYNSFELFPPDGEKASPYQKLHLFKPGKENLHFNPGRHAPQCFQWQGIRIGFGICHDLRYPELFLHQHWFEPDLFIITAQWPMARVEHWQALLKARAIENQCYVLGCNGVGASELGHLAGHSCLITSWGRISFSLSNEVGMKKSGLQAEVILTDRRGFDSRRSDFFHVDYAGAGSKD